MDNHRTPDILLVGNAKQHDLNTYVGGRNERIVKGVRSRPTIRDFYDVEYCSRGGLTLLVNGTEHQISAGDLYIVPPLAQAERHFTGDVTSAIYVGIKGINLNGYLKTLGFSQENVVFPHTVTDFCIECLENLIDSLDAYEHLIMDEPNEPLNVNLIKNNNYLNHLPYKNELRQTGYFSLFLSELMRIREMHIRPSEKESVQQQYIQSAKRYIEANYHLKITVDDIANHIGITRSYLFKLFRSELNISVQEYIIEVRMKNACDFLRQPNALIKNIATALGYDPFSFSRIFKKTIGMSPREYQQKYGK
ncbi:MAG: AraC family transcriptional regulator [Oscillospiraceae bacterium]|nr:AraC family transcriptional regulator [Oscillospiraceae bacterium]